MKKIDTDLLIRLLDMNKYSNVEISEIVQCSVRTVVNYKRKLSLTAKSEKIDSREVLHLFNQGLSVDQLSEIFGCTRRNIYYCLQRVKEGK